MKTYEVRLLLKIVMGVSLVLVAATVPFKSWPITLSMMIGVIAGTANFYLIIKVVGQLLGMEKVRRARLIFFLMTKILLLMGVVALLVMKGNIAPIPFLIGVSNTVLAAVVYGFWSFIGVQKDASS